MKKKSEKKIKEERPTERTVSLTPGDGVFMLPSMWTHPPAATVSTEEENRLLVPGTDGWGGRELPCTQLLLWFPRETAVEAAERSEWEGSGLAHMGQSSARAGS